MKSMRWLVLGLASVCAVVAQADTREVAQKHLEAYQAYLGAPVDEFHFWKFDRWQPLGPAHVAVWTTPNQAYLLTVDGTCPNLEWADDIGVTSQAAHVVSRRFDYVTFGNQRCHIERIESIDLKRMKADGKLEG